MRIDAHHHVWDLGVRDQPWTANLAPPAPLVRTSASCARRCSPTGRRDGGRPDDPGRRRDARTARARCGRADGRGRCRLGRPHRTRRRRPAGRSCGRCPGGDRLVGVRHQRAGEPDPRWLCRPDVRRGLAAVAEAGLAYDLLVVPVQMPAAVETVTALPDLRFVLDHAGKPALAIGWIASWRADVRALAALPNVAVKLSGLITEADHASWTVQQLRPVRPHPARIIRPANG